MTGKSSDPDQSATPQDIATLYSRANVQGNKYWDFSASRKEVRGQFRHRMVQAERAGAERQAARPQRQDEDQVQVPQLEPQARREGPGPPAQGAGSGPAAGSETPPQPREGMASGARWYALHSVFARAEVAVPPPASPEQRPPIVAVFSLAGGVGKTCLVATLGRALSALGERVLLADTAAYGLLPFYFGSRGFKPGVVRTFSPPGAECDPPVHVLNLEVERSPGDGGEHDPLPGELVREGRGTSYILVDVATASRDVTSRLLLLRPTVLVPILPDMSSVASLASLEAFLASATSRASPDSPEGGMSKPFYLLNQFDGSSPLHLDVREMLQQQLGDRLLPIVLCRSSEVSEALAEGMTVIDYAPGSAAAEDYWNLAGWLRSLASPATVGYGGVRWSER